MPTYKFSCTNCSASIEESYSIAEYNSLKNNFKCSVCDAGFLKRVFNSTNSNIDRSSEEIKANMKEEIMAHVQKVKSGDISAVSDIYGQELNKLKVK